MSELRVVHADMTEAANAAQTAAAGARGRDSAAAVMAAAGALPGSDVSGHLDDLALSWTDEVVAWSADTADFGTSLAEAGEDYREVDGGIGPLFGRALGGILGGGR